MLYPCEDKLAGLAAKAELAATPKPDLVRTPSQASFPPNTAPPTQTLQHSGMVPRNLRQAPQGTSLPSPIQPRPSQAIQGQELALQNPLPNQAIQAQQPVQAMLLTSIPGQATDRNLPVRNPLPHEAVPSSAQNPIPGRVVLQNPIPGQATQSGQGMLPNPIPGATQSGQSMLQNPIRAKPASKCSQERYQVPLTWRRATETRDPRPPALPLLGSRLRTVHRPATPASRPASREPTPALAWERCVFAHWVIVCTFRMSE